MALYCRIFCMNEHNFSLMSHQLNFSFSFDLETRTDYNFKFRFDIKMKRGILFKKIKQQHLIFQFSEGKK
jgi:hypothetical protein